MKKSVKNITGIAAAVIAAAAGFTMSSTKVTADDNLGTAGRLYFSNGYSVALNYADPYDAYAVQAVTDAWDSAVVEVTDWSTLIADHNTQGFEVIKDYGVGSTVTIVDEYGNSTQYVCISYYSDASWYEGMTVLPDGRNAWEGDSGLWFKTCNDNGTNTVSYWMAV